MTYQAQLSDSNDELFFPKVTTESINDIEKLVLKDDYSAFKNSQELLLPEQNEKIDGLVNNTQTVANGIKAVNDNNTTWSVWKKDGMSLQNGAQIYSSDQDFPVYRTRLVNGSQQVQIKFRIKNLTLGNDTTYVGIPSSIQPEAYSQLSLSFPSSNGITATWGFGNGAIQLHANTNNDFNASYTYPFFATLEVN